MFVEDLGRPGLAGLWAETAEAGAPDAHRPLAESPGSWAPVAAVCSGPRSPEAQAALHAFKDAIDADRSVAAAS